MAVQAIRRRSSSAPPSVASNISDCASDVIFYTITGGGHTWPGGKPLPEWLTGATTTEIDATRLMWEFFQEHPLEPEWFLTT